MRRKPTAIDLFAGCGGLTVGLKRAGFEVIGAIENEPHASRVYRLNHGDVHLWEQDIRGVPAVDVMDELSLEPGDLDLLAGCPPCQGFSTLRTLNGHRRVRDSRNDLIYEFSELVYHLEPRAVMLENVPGLARNRRLSEFRQELEELGYSVWHGVLDAADYGVPQRRRRVILLAVAARDVPVVQQARKKRTVRDAIAGLPRAGRSDDPLHDLPESRSPRVQEMIRLTPKNGGSRSDLPKRLTLPCHRECDGFKDVYGRMAWDDVAPTLTTGCFNPSRGRFLHPTANRAISMREAALLQTFPARYKFPVDLGKQAIAKLIGNAFPPEFVRRQAKAIRLALEDQG